MRFWQWIKIWHLIAMVAWFAGLFYLPRLFVYHTQAKHPETLTLFATMEHKLMHIIMIPASITTVGCGLWLSWYKSYLWGY